MKNKLIVISSYPERSKIHGEKTVGGASYTKNLLNNLKKTNKNIEIEVLAEIHEKKEKYKEGGININRIWKRSSILSLINLALFVLGQPEDNIIVSFELYMFGGVIENVFLLFIFLLWKLAGKKNFLILHQVVMNFKIAYWPIILLSEKIIVFEEKFRSVLNNKKVYFIPHAVEKATLTKKAKKKQKNSLNFLYFGYLSPYKGADFLVNSWKKDFGKLCLAGGGNPNHINNKKYSRAIEKLVMNANKKRVKTTGFIPEEKISHYFLNSDLLILPYKMFFSSSGPLSFAFAYEKAFILSRPLEDYFDSPDFAEALEETGLKKEDFLFDFNQKSFEQRLNWAKNNLNKLAKFSRIMKEKRIWSKIGKEYEKLLNQV